MRALKIIISTIALALFFGGCAYDFIPQEEVVDPDDPSAETISFSTEIVPIFASKCVGCHTAGETTPDLSTNNAYSSLNSSRYVNKSTPESSLIYTKPTGSHYGTYSDAEAAKILLWIKQGAQDN